VDAEEQMPNKGQDPFDLERFVTAQQSDYQRAIAEIKEALAQLSINHAGD